MSGHSHWAGIKYKKGLQDTKRGKLFSKLARNIMSAARMGGGDVDMNLKLKYAIEKAKEANMPKDNIERAIKKGTGELGGENFEQLVYEGYGPGGVAIMLDILTDNKNRTASDVRNIFDKHGGHLGESGCVAWMFTTKGLFNVPANTIDEENLLMIAMEAGADNFENLDDEVYEITTSVENFEAVKETLEKYNVQTEIAEISRIPSNYLDLDIADAKKVLKLMEDLEDNEDVQNIYANFNIPKELAQQE